ncbi:MAG TPA: serine/threonine-protein kinase, partial [Steroidobacteraceae bacterium]|nr:serine/threonine-protein kinase [Steroidobacteraceae bacterium]
MTSKSSADSVNLMRTAMAQLDALLQKDEAERALLLAGLADSQPAVHVLVLELLAAEREASGGKFLEPVRWEHSHGNAPTLEPDSELGPYRIVRRLGAGGMGEVWLARRIDRPDSPADAEIAETVALKTLHPHLANTVLRERFTREAHILGKLTHKNIARLHDAGVSESGIAYLVLEYVEGETLDAWCDARSLPIRARLELFLSVCAAVAHAHAHLVIHRDLKPSNILVARAGGVKLLDFGVAKLVQGDEAGVLPTALTQFGGRIFTPEYASPEQILGESVTTAADVYALGVLLYGLLAGTRPYPSTTTGRELERAILNEEPVALTKLPSDRVDEIARQRSITPAKLMGALAGDLEYIVARAMRKSPKDRYGSVLAFAVDIERYLRQQPIEAREGTGIYRLSRWVQRHRAATIATAVSIVALVTGTGVAVWQAQVARAEARKATAIKEFLVGVFERNNVAHPDGAVARKTTAEELLAQSAG